MLNPAIFPCSHRCFIRRLFSPPSLVNPDIGPTGCFGSRNKPRPSIFPPPSIGKKRSERGQALPIERKADLHTAGDEFAGEVVHRHPLSAPAGSPGRRGGRSFSVRRSRARKPQIVRARLSSPVFAFATMPWKYPPGDDRK
jgi:hypothetical protein